MLGNYLKVDDTFLTTYNIPVVKGRIFDPNISSDRDAYLINESLARSLNWGNPLGKTINRSGDHPVIGVVKDFKFDTLHRQIEPLIITRFPWKNKFDYLSVKIASLNVSRTMEHIKKAWERVVPALPYEFFFLDESIDHLYKAEERFRGLFLGFSILAIVIALLGLFSLASFSLKLRSKEIGIRKVLGATKKSIFLVFSKQFFFLILVSNVIALPAAYLLTDNWLKNFAYRNHLSIRLFVFVLCGSLVTALLTIAYQVLKASNKNPIEELKYE